MTMIGTAFIFVVLTHAQIYARVLNVEIQVHEPRGLSVSLPDASGIEAVYFWANVNEEFTSANKGKIRLGAIRPVDGKWVIYDDDLQLKGGDVINYVLFIKRYSAFERYDRNRFVVPGSIQSNAYSSSSTTLATPTSSTPPTTSLSTSTQTTNSSLNTSSDEPNVRQTSVPPNTTIASGSTARPTSQLNITSVTDEFPFGPLISTTTASSLKVCYSSTNSPNTIASTNTSSTTMASIEILNVTRAESVDTFQNNASTATINLIPVSSDSFLTNATAFITTSSYQSPTTREFASHTTSTTIGSTLSKVSPTSTSTVPVTSLKSVGTHQSTTSTTTNSLPPSTRLDTSIRPLISSSTMPSSSYQASTSAFSVNIPTSKTMFSPTSSSTKDVNLVPTSTTPVAPRQSTSTKGKPRVDGPKNNCAHKIFLKTVDFTLDFYGNVDMSHINPKMLASLVVNDCNVEYKIAEKEEPKVVEFNIF